jgi:uncharacterized protein (DUF305 family)
MKSTTHHLRPISGLLMVVLASLAVAACGGSGSSSTSAGDSNGIDRAFATEMVRHHQAAIDMAKVAEDRAGRPEIKSLATAIVTAQEQEIAELKAADKRLAARGVETGDLELPASMMGMDMDSAELMTAEPFDRAFIDMMVPHHQGAIRMARVQLAKGKDPQLRKLATAVIAAQSKEIDQMNAWRMDWYGAESPTGGVPPTDEKASDMPGMDHSGM